MNPWYVPVSLSFVWASFELGFSHKEPEFKEERVVIRDEDLESQKKGWFSSKRKKPTARPSHVSRPPSTPTLGPHAKPSSPLPNSSLEDDLPPRADAMDAVTPLATHATATSSERQSNDSTPDIPAHAGFDLNAIREAIVEAAQHKSEELDISHTGEEGQVRLPAPQHTAVSARLTPPPLIIRLPDEPSDTNSDVTLIGVSNVAQSTLGSLDDAQFASVLSLRDQGVHDGRQFPMYAAEGGDISEDDGLARTTNISPRNPTTASYTVTEEATWSTSVSGGLRPPGTPGSFRSPFEMSADAHSRPAVASTSPPYSIPADLTTSLSFGSLDGKITSHAVEQDPWSAPVKGKSPTNYLSNPWST